MIVKSSLSLSENPLDPSVVKREVKSGQADVVVRDKALVMDVNLGWEQGYTEVNLEVSRRGSIFLQ